MKNCFYQYRKGLYDLINGNVTYSSTVVPVYEFAPSTIDTPYIIIGNMNSDRAEDDDYYSQTVTTDLIVVTSYKGDIGKFGSKQANEIIGQIMGLLIDRADGKVVTMTDFTDNGAWFNTLRSEAFFDGSTAVIVMYLNIGTGIDEV